MPRLIPKRSKWRDDQLVVAVEEVANIIHLPMQATRPGVLPGQVLRGSDPRVKRHPDSFAPAPTDVKGGPALRPNELAAVAAVSFAADGILVSAGRRFHPYDQLVLQRPHLFRLVAPG
ncbi:MAG: hypothetical protein ACRDNR_12375 [Gaiellaceae bacterium]